MFILTTKFNKKKAVIGVLILAAVLIAVVLIAGGIDQAGNAEETAALSAVVKNNEQRVNYLKALGWEVDSTVLEEQKVVIPRQFTDVYKRYNELQLSQGFDLSKFGGIEAMRYTYKILNYPGTDAAVVADIIVYRNEIIAGDVQSNALNGFMTGLEYPKDSDTSTTAPAADAQNTPGEDISSDSMSSGASDSSDAAQDSLSASGSADSSDAEAAASAAPSAVVDTAADAITSDSAASEDTAS